MDTDYDIIIIGGGMVGASLASALADVKLRIGVVEAVAFNHAQQPSYDERTQLPTHCRDRGVCRDRP